MQDINPFEAPVTIAPSQRPAFPDDVAWRDLSTLVAVEGCELPGGCVLCHASDGGNLRAIQLSWSPSHGIAGFLLGISIIGWPILLAWNYVTRKQMLLKYRVCGWHEWRTWQVQRLAFALFLTTCFVGGSVPLMSASPLVAIIFLLPLLSAVTLFAQTKFLQIRKIEDGKLWITGVSDGYLQTLPEWPGQSSVSPIWRLLGKCVCWMTRQRSTLPRQKAGP